LVVARAGSPGAFSAMPVALVATTLPLRSATVLMSLSFGTTNLLV
jgi:hypothetical protein